MSPYGTYKSMWIEFPIDQMNEYQYINIVFQMHPYVIVINEYKTSLNILLSVSLLNLYSCSAKKVNV